MHIDRIPTKVHADLKLIGMDLVRDPASGEGQVKVNCCRNFSEIFPEPLYRSKKFRALAFPTDLFYASASQRQGAKISLTRTVAATVQDFREF